MDSLLPPNATALELNIDARLSALSINIKHNKNPGLIDVFLLDLLAQELSVDYWSSNWGEAKKRATIKASVEIHRHKGTLYAVRTAIEQITQDYQIIEWFVDSALPQALPAVLATGSGAPNTVEVVLSVNTSASATKEVLAAIDNAKPLHVHAAVSISQSVDAELALIAAGYFETHLMLEGIAKVGFGNTGYTPSVNTISLQSEQIKLAPSSAIAKDNKITLINQLSGSQEFSIREIAICLDDDTLLCLWSSVTQVAGEKVANTIFKITIVLELSGVDASNVSFTINDFAHAELHTYINDTNGHGVDDHKNDKNNPHKVTAKQLGAVTHPELDTYKLQVDQALNNLNQLVLSITANTVAGVDFGVVSNIAANSTDNVGVVLVLVLADHSDNFDKHTTNTIILHPEVADKDYVITNTRTQLSASKAYKAKAFVEHKNSKGSKLPKIYYSNFVNFTGSVNRNWIVSGASNLGAAKVMVTNWCTGDTITFSWQSAYHIGTGNGSAIKYRTETRTETC
ncbi:MAG: Tail protein I [Candidatus Ruthia sp. Apha_13_S6]|nr:Tail protein I [Candidatus Ruthia sp. Apha_13_S6]